MNILHKVKGVFSKQEKAKKNVKGNAKKKPEPPPKILKRTTDLLALLDIDKRGNIKCKNTYMYIYQLSTFDLAHLNDYDAERLITEKVKFYRSYGDDIKEVSLNMPDNTEMQQAYFRRKIKNCSNPLHRKILEEKLYELEWLERERSTRSFYLFLYGATVEELEVNKAAAIRALRSSTQTIELSEEKIYALLFKLLNKNSKILL